LVFKCYDDLGSAMNDIEYQLKHVAVDGIGTGYIEAGTGAPLILVHGGGAGVNGYSNWFATLPLFAEHFHVLAVDMLGFGATDKPDPGQFEYSQDARIQHIAGFVKALGLQPANLLGNAMGGATVLGVAATRPELVDKLILTGSAGVDPSLNEAVRPVMGYDYTPEGMARLIEVMTHESFHPAQELIDYRYENSISPENRIGYDATIAWVRKRGGLFYPEEFIARVKAPTLVVNGKQDRIVTVAQAYRMLELIQNSAGYIIPNCGHWTMIEHPVEFAGVVTQFIQTH
jgi:2-hydroxy-6-oxo-6-(2'-aminophenyl)hexa-2,4-dienoate hydrolase